MLGAPAGKRGRSHLFDALSPIALEAAAAWPDPALSTQSAISHLAGGNVGDGTAILRTVHKGAAMLVSAPWAQPS